MQIAKKLVTIFVIHMQVLSNYIRTYSVFFQKRMIPGFFRSILNIEAINV